METNIETSIFLAKVIGLVSVISTTAILLRYRESMALEKEAVKSPVNAYLSGFVFLIIGVLIIVSHSVWTLDWRLVITVLGWLVFLKGIGRIFFPKAVRQLIEKKDRKFLIGEVVVLLVGIFLLYYGFIAY